MIIDELLQQCSPVTFTALESLSGVKRVRLTIGMSDYEAECVADAILMCLKEQPDDTQTDES